MLKVRLVIQGNVRRRLDGDLIYQYLVNNGFEVKAMHKIITEVSREREEHLSVDLTILILCVVNNSKEILGFEQIELLEDGGSMPMIIGGCFPKGCTNQKRLGDRIVANTSQHPSQIVPALRRLGHKVKDWDDSIVDSKRKRLQVNRGCQGLCTYCVIKNAVRGVKSMPLDEVRRKQDLMDDDYGVIGEDVGSWGDDLGMNMGDLLKVLNPKKVRFIGCIIPWRFNQFFKEIKEFVDKKNDLIILESDIQTGSQRILNEMGRLGDVEEFKRNVIELKKNPNVIFMTDIIVGFPGETDEEWQETVNLVSECRFDRVRQFIFSARPNTPASFMPKQISENIKEERKLILGNAEFIKGNKFGREIKFASEKVCEVSKFWQ